MKKVLLLFGGNSSEHLVSCRSAKSIITYIDKKKFDLTTVGITKDNEWFCFSDSLDYLENGDWTSSLNLIKIDNIVAFLKSFDVVFPIIHGNDGEDGKIQGFLDLFGIPYVGCNHKVSSIGMDKDFSKIFFDAIGIPQLPSVTVFSFKDSITEIEKCFSYPMIIKPCNGGSSIGIVKVNNKKELIKGLQEASTYDSKLLIEPFVKMRELECALLEKNGKLIISPIGEVVSANEFYDYSAKYENCGSKTFIAKDLSDATIKEIHQYCKKIFYEFGLRGLSRIDFFYDEENKKVYLNEINTLPGFTPISMYPSLMKAAHISYSKLITILLLEAS